MSMRFVPEYECAAERHPRHQAFKSLVRHDKSLKARDARLKRLEEELKLARPRYEERA